MRVEWQTAPISQWEAEIVLFFSFENSPVPPAGLERWLEQEGSWLTQSLALKDFQAKAQEVGVFYGPSNQRIPRALCIGLGPRDAFDLERLRNGAAAALRKCQELRLLHPALPLSTLDGLPVGESVALREFLIGGIAGIHEYNALKTRDMEGKVSVESVTILCESEPPEAVHDVIPAAEAIASGICLARDLVNAPANLATPAFLLDTASRLAADHGFRMKVIDREEAKQIGMGAFCAVAQGSREPAYLVVLEHAPQGTENDAPLALVGKGITFDTGGISLKHSDKLDAMKQDMAGAAAVLGVFRVLGALKPPARVVGILPCTENMPDGKAYKPGDVIHSLSGLTIEVISTDAEGRMVLCDALTYAVRMHPAAIVDIATLTGACIVALGKQVAGVMGNRDRFTQNLQEIGMRVGERIWPLPLWDLYFDSIKSDVADFKNVGDRSAGSIIGGIFLKQFVPNEIPWIHLDIAGTAWADKDPRGGTGFGVRTLVEFVRRWPNVALE